MLITIKVPDNLPQKRLRQQIRNMEERLRKEAEHLEAEKIAKYESSQSNEPWTNPDMELPSVDTGIEDFSISHDHYLYGTPKIS
jgi:hypothetical protein